jgi:DNA-directed RNA polymerase specialized sigma24 family protein
MDHLLAGVADASRKESWSSRFVNGDETVLGQLLETWAPPLVRMLAWKYRGIFAKDQLEQIVLDALCAGWTKRQMFDPEKSSVVAWLDRIVQNLVADNAKSSSWKQRCQETSLANWKDDELPDRAFQKFSIGEEEADPKSFRSPEMSGLLKALTK